MGAKLLQAAALAAVLVPLGSLSAEASSIGVTCSFGTASTCDVPDAIPGGEGNWPGAIFRWPDETYTLSLNFINVRGPFTITVFNEEVSQTALQSRLVGPFANQVCVPIDAGLGNCVVFHFSSADGGTTPGDNTWLDDWTVRVNWIPDTNSGYPGSTVRVLHARGDDCVGVTTGGCSNNPNDPFDGEFDDPTNDAFDTDITVPGSYCSEDCLPDFGDEVEFLGLGSDPEIAGTDNNFQSVVVTSQQAVPEPATLLLLSAGLIGLWYRKRRA